MEIQVGEYIRTKDGYIGKCQKIDVYYGDILIRTELKRIINDFEAIKHSFNIIDLIEIDDYVNKKRVIEVYRPEGTYVEFIKLDNELPLAEDNEIKSIVTKEQFEAMQYVIKEG